jgi:uncharacterized protein
VIFVDTNVWMYAVGRPHPLRDRAREFLRAAVTDRTPLATSAEVLQELFHTYLPVERLTTLDAALKLAGDLAEVWPLEADDLLTARDLVAEQPGLSARDLVHLACCLRRRADEVVTFDRALAAAAARLL